MFTDQMPFTGLADEWIPRLNLLKRCEHDITVAVSGAVPEVPADWEIGVGVAVQVDAVDVANQSLLSSLSTLPKVRNRTLSAVEFVKDVGRLAVDDGLDGDDLTRVVKGDTVLDLTRGQVRVGAEAARFLMATSPETWLHSPGYCVSSLRW